MNFKRNDKIPGEAFLYYYSNTLSVGPKLRFFNLQFENELSRIFS